MRWKQSHGKELDVQASCVGGGQQTKPAALVAPMCKDGTSMVESASVQGISQTLAASGVRHWHVAAFGQHKGQSRNRKGGSTGITGRLSTLLQARLRHDLLMVRLDGRVPGLKDRFIENL